MMLQTRILQTRNPATGEVVQSFDEHTDEEVETRLSEAAAASAALRLTTIAERAAWMRGAADLLDQERDTLARMLTIEMGKPLAQAVTEVGKCARTMRYYADHAAGLLAEVSLPDPAVVGASRAVIRYEPLGTVLAVMPWNYPLWQVVRFAAPALMAGNTGVLKHASNVPQSALYLDTLFERGGFPCGSFRTLLIASGRVAKVIEDRRIHAVTLTGSEPAGRAVAATAAAALKKSVLELGGSDPFLVLPSADVDAAVTTAVKARTQNNGQSCIAAKRFIVHEAVFDRFAAGFVKAMAALVVGNPLKPGTDVGPIATAAGRDELHELVEDARGHGAEILTGGSLPQGPGWFYPPTVVAGITPQMRLFHEEAFGPVASLYRVDSVDEAVEVANATRFGLSAALFSRDEEEISKLIPRIASGGLFVNGMTASAPELPFGGIGDSGYGRELSAIGMHEFCNVRTIWTA